MVCLIIEKTKKKYEMKEQTPYLEHHSAWIWSQKPNIWNEI